MSTRERRDLEFISGGERCAAWLYEPAGRGPHPLAILAHGFGADRRARLWAYAERFRGAGIAAFVFDYRHFGASGGEPRHLLSIRRQHQDWRAAIAFARRLEGIDPGRVALWGTSYSGGHVVALAASDPRIAAVISQTPMADGPATLAALPPLTLLRLAIAGLRDLAGTPFGRDPHLLPIAGRPGETAAMPQPGSHEGFFALYDEPTEFPNTYSARAGIELARYRPARRAAEVRCPLLVLTCAADAVTPPEPARRMAEVAPRGRAIEYGNGYGHFDIYVGELFERTIADQIAFLGEHLGLPRAPR